MSQEIHFHIDLRLTRRSLKAGMVLFVSLFCAGDLGSESVTLTTYYPAPSGIYTKLVTTGKSVFGTGPGNPMVGIGTVNPSQKLDIDVGAGNSGGIRIEQGGTMIGLIGTGGFVTSGVAADLAINSAQTSRSDRV